MSKRPRSGPSPTVIKCAKQANGVTRCCTFKRGEETGEALRCFNSGASRKAKRQAMPPKE